MKQILIIEKENIKEEKIDNIENLYKKCKFKKADDFIELMKWKYKNFEIKLFGKMKGKSHTKFLYKFPNFEKNIYGNISIICTNNNKMEDININFWRDFLENMDKEKENEVVNELQENHEEEEELEEEEDNKEDEEKDNLEEEMKDDEEKENKEDEDEEEDEGEEQEEIEEKDKEENIKFDVDLVEDIRYYSGSELSHDEYYYTSEDEENK